MLIKREVNMICNWFFNAVIVGNAFLQHRSGGAHPLDTAQEIFTYSVEWIPFPSPLIQGHEDLLSLPSVTITVFAKQHGISYEEVNDDDE
jgi:hypothetical protein